MIWLFFQHKFENKMILIKVYMFLGFFFLSKAQTNIFRPNLPMGEVRLIINKFYPCEKTNNLPIEYNLYLNRKSMKITEVKGNVTLRKPFDDSLILDVNVASWSLTGGWKPSSIVYVTNNCCSKLKIGLGKSWFSTLKAFNVSSDNCPIPVGTYISSGLDIKMFDDNSFPTVYFYGKYKYVIRIKSKEKQLLGCIAVEIDLVRPWEVPTD